MSLFSQFVKSWIVEMEIPKKEKSGKPLHVPKMGKTSREIGVVVTQVLGSYVVDDLRREVKDLRSRLQHHVDFLEEIMESRRNCVEPRIDMATPYPHCHFCYALVQPSSDFGGVCPCGDVGYCSEECQKLDWKRTHKNECTYYVN